MNCFLGCGSSITSGARNSCDKNLNCWDVEVVGPADDVTCIHTLYAVTNNIRFPSWPRRITYDHLPITYGSLPFSMIRDVQLLLITVTVPPGCISPVIGPTLWEVV
jgi:hypothetical protein